MELEKMFNRGLIIMVILLLAIVVISTEGAEEIETYTVGMEVTGKVIHDNKMYLTMSGSGECGMIATSEEAFCNSRIGEVLEVEVSVIQLVGGEIIKEFEIKY